MSLPSSLRCYQLDRDKFAHIFSSQLVYLFSLFHEHEYDLRLVGGVVRDVLLGVTPHDVDLATTATTQNMLKLIEGDSNIDLVRTRAEHFGTLTFVVGTTVHETFQVTTLKRAIVRQGKDVRVEFTTNWSIDAHQRDLSINSLSMDEHGIVYDYTNGVEDLKMGRIRFNQNPVDRIEDNPIRALRYFRFFGRLSSDPHAHELDTLSAIRKCGMALKYCPGEKIWIELKLILRGPFAGHLMRTILEQRFAPVLGLPESSVEMFELENRWLRCMEYRPEPMTLLVTLFDNQQEFDTFCARVRCSLRHKRLGQFLLDHRYLIQPLKNEHDDVLRPYKELIVDVHQTQQQDVHRYVVELLKYQGYVYLVNDMEQWNVPHFPVNSWDLQHSGLMCGRHFPRLLQYLRQWWKANNYDMTRDELIAYGFQSGLFYT